MLQAEIRYSVHLIRLNIYNWTCVPVSMSDSYNFGTVVCVSLSLSGLQGKYATGAESRYVSHRSCLLSGQERGKSSVQYLYRIF